MSDSKIVEFKHIRLEPADNGYVLEYTEVKEKPESMDSRDWIDRQMVFTDENIDESIDAALAKMKEMYLFNKKSKGNPGMEAPEMKGATIKVNMG